MNGCHEYQEMISRMLDDDLSRQEKLALAEHVKRCPDCAAVYVAFRSLSEHLNEELEEPSPDLHEKIMSDVRREALRAKNSLAIRHRRVRMLTTIAACLVLVIAAALSFPKIAKQKNAAVSDSIPMEAAVEKEAVRAEEPMTVTQQFSASEEAAAEEPAVVADGSFAANTAPNSMPAEEPEAVDYRGVIREAEDGTLILDEKKSEHLEELMSGEKLALNGSPDREIKLIYLHKGTEKKLTVLLRGETAVYVMADGDSYCRFDASASELLELLELTD